MVRVFSWEFTFSLLDSAQNELNNLDGNKNIINYTAKRLFCHSTMPSLHYVFASWHVQVDRIKRIWYLSPMRAAMVQASLRIRAVSPEPSLLAHTSGESSGTFRQKARSLAPLNGWACAVEICHDGMLEDTNSLDGAQVLVCMLVKCTVFIG